ncbi:MAG: hypothetical protein U5K74_01275 [Gemmatimonadaceae bacterium]|nr:hypothetical protein [Gemmatimonadaceae bacterium]
MVRFAPTHTGAWDAYESSAVRKFSRSLVAMALVTGVLWRLCRALFLGTGPTHSPLFFGSVIALGVVMFFGMATLHLGNYPLKKWLWRVPLFALVEGVAEIATAAVLIAFRLEPNGSTLAEWGDLGGIATWVLSAHLVALAAYAGTLAAVVQGIRRSMSAAGDVVIDDPKDDK